MPATTTWPLEPHTRAKHQILRYYLDGWFPILASRQPKVLYLDGFAGPGVYSGGEPGSPIIALRALLEHPQFDRFSKCEFLFLFCEEDGPRHASLVEEVQAYAASLPGGTFPPNVKYRPFLGTFEDAAKQLVAKNKLLVPTLALVDPFGFSGAPMKVVAQLLRSPRCEVLFNFMIEQVNRWVTSAADPAAMERLTELFGTDEYRSAPKSGPPRLEFLHDLYESQLRAHGFKYTRSFQMVNSRGRTGYYLFFGTRHEAGLRVMKRAMWRVDSEQGKRFSDLEVGTTSLFAGEVDTRPLQAAIQARFGGGTAAMTTIETFVNCETDYLADSHLKRKTLVPMEKAGIITRVEGRGKAGSFPEACSVTFA